MTTPHISPSHVAVLVPSVEKAANYLKKFDFQIGAVDEFQETFEIYIQYGHSNSLLLMEPKGPGSYQRAIEKRGPGIHHLAIDVLDLNGYLKSITGSGWFLHLNSINSIKDYKTAYLVRPGFPLIEVQEKESFSKASLFVEKITLPLDPKHTQLMKAVGLDDIVNSGSKRTITLAGKNIELNELFL
jgi:hypothetical protein